MRTALEYLSLVPGEATAETAVLRDRIYRCGAPGVAEAAPQPPFPFISEDVPVLAPPPPPAQAQQPQPAAAAAYGAQPAPSAGKKSLRRLFA
jgi:hypothetical protein